MIAAWFARVGWLGVAKVVLPGLGGLLVAGVAWWAWSVFDHTRIERDIAVADVLEMRRTITAATVPPNAKGEQPLLSTADAKAALAAVVRDRDDARSNLGRIDRDTKAAKLRSDDADKDLARVQTDNRARLARAQSRIEQLEAVKPTADAITDAAGIDDDSKAAWESWR